MGESFEIFVAIASAIVVEAMPFLAFGALLSAIIEVCVPPERLARAVPRHWLGQIAVGVGGGFIVPTCECGVVPVARRLLRKGVPGPAVVAYLLSAPIVNPVVLASTYLAFGRSGAMVIARVALAALVASTVALLVRRESAETLLRPGAAVGHDHDHAGSPSSSKWTLIWVHAGRDLLDMGKYLILGAFAAALFKTFLPPAWLASFDQSQVLAIVGMMVLAVVLSVCSEADAFVAASFVTVPAAAQLAFVTLGPMVDIKLIGLYAVTFQRRLFLLLIGVPVVLVFFACLVLGAWL